MKIDLALMEQFATLGIGSAPVTGDQVSGEFADLLSQLVASDAALNSESYGLTDGENAESLADMLLAELDGEIAVGDQLETGEGKIVNTPIIQALNGQLVLVANVNPKEGSAGVPLTPEASDIAAAKIKASAFIDNEKAGGKNADMGKVAVPGSGADAETAANKPEGKGLFEQISQSVKNEMVAKEDKLPVDTKAVNDAVKAVPDKANAVPVDPKAVPVDPKAVSVDPKAVPVDPKAVSVDPKAVPDAVKALNDQKPADFRSSIENSDRQTSQPASEAALVKPEQQVTGSSDSAQKPLDNMLRSENGASKAQAGTSASEQPVLGQQPSIQGDHGVRAEAVLQSQQNPNLRESVMQQLEGRMIYLRETGNNPAEMRMTLHPPELGEVTIRVFSKQGKLSASIIAETTLVKEILESSISELRQRLNFVTIQFEQLDLSTSGRQSGESDRPSRNFNPDELAQLGIDRPDHLTDERVNDPLRASPGGEIRGVDYFA